MACRFEYIDKASISDEAKQKAEAKHIELAKQILTSKLAYWSNSKLTVYKDNKENFEDFVRLSSWNCQK